MKKGFIASGTVLIALAITGIWLMQKEEPVPEVNEQTSEVVNQKSEAFKQRVLASPETFEAQTVVKREAPVPLTVPTERPKQLSEVEKAPQVAAVKEPVPVESLYFYKDYESMRKEEISNPDSEENRAGVVALLQARQRRASQD